MASLYQLRGRVGRSDRQAYAYFMTNSSDEDTTSRLDTIKVSIIRLSRDYICNSVPNDANGI